MSYRCQVCGCKVPPHRTRRTFILWRQVPKLVHGAVDTRPEIAREIPCCGACHVQLEGGTPLAVVARTRRRQLAEDAAKRGEEPTPNPAPILPSSVPLAVALKMLAPKPKVLRFGKGGAK